MRHFLGGNCLSLLGSLASGQTISPLVGIR
jgi:hypothetical protein